MQNRKKFTASFRRLFRKGAGRQEKELFAHWFSRLDLSEGKIFRDEEEEQALEKKMEQNLYDHFFNSSAPAKIFRIPSWLPAAAAAVLIVVAGLGWFISVQKTVPQSILAESFTHTGERKIITLPDGSKITLNNSSRLKFPQSFSRKMREVFLDGEAFFEVAHDKNRPFIVRAGKLNVQVLGTSFNIRHYDTDKTIDVVVATGRVGIHAKNIKNSLMLTPGNRLTYNPLTGETEESTVNPVDYTAWQKGKLVFNNERLENICKQLQRWYGVRITIKTELLKNKRISLKQNNESLQTVLKVLAMTGDFKYEIKGKAVQIW
jgi:transmembrane sensor